MQNNNDLRVSKNKSNEQVNQGGGNHGNKSGWRKKKNATDSDGKKQKSLLPH